MLVLTRKKNQSIIINDNIEITVLDIQDEQVRLGINAPRAISVHRKEVFLEIEAENRRAAEVGQVDFKGIINNK
ncbi:MAG: carbon storage regulator CsrA [Acetivibrionales bacterium]|jgi:carbon storage regulator